MTLKLQRRYLIISRPSNTLVCYFIIRTRRDQKMWQALAKSSDITIILA